MPKLKKGCVLYDKIITNGRGWRDWKDLYGDWEAGPAFFIAGHGVMLHRVRSVSDHKRCGKTTHTSCSLWCGGNGFPVRNDNRKAGTLYTDPPEGRLLCERCEAHAVAAGEKPADEIAGRHIHTGRMVPKQTCCRKQKESN